MIRAAAILVVCALLFGSSARVPAPPAPTADDLFAGDTIPTLQIAIDDDALDALAHDPKEYVRARVRVGDATWGEVGVRIKGNRSMQSFDGKPGLKLHFGKYDKRARFYGLEKLALNNMVEDPTMLRESLAYALHRAAGVPAPRTAYVQVYVNRRPYGLYLLVEPPPDDDRELYEGNYGCDLYADDVDGFEQDGGDKERTELRSLAAAAAGPELFAELDRPRVLAYLAVSAYIGDFDGYRHAHNYRLHHGEHGWAYLPWGQDRTFKKHLPVYDSGGLVAKRCFADDACRADFDRTLREVARLAATLPDQLDRTVERIDTAVRRDPRRPYGVDEIEKRRDQLRRYLATRTDEVLAQLGTRTGEACNGVDDDLDGAIDDDPSCGCATQVIDGVTYAICDRPATWAEAQASCVAQGMTLASDGGGLAARLRSKTKWWIGARSERDPGQCNRDCAAVRGGGNGAARGTHCAARLPYVCRAL